MAFIYYGQGVSSLYQDFVERLMSQLALKGDGDHASEHSAKRSRRG